MDVSDRNQPSLPRKPLPAELPPPTTPTNSARDLAGYTVLLEDRKPCPSEQEVNSHLVGACSYAACVIIA